MIPFVQLIIRNLFGDPEFGGSDLTAACILPTAYCPLPTTYRWLPTRSGQNAPKCTISAMFGRASFRPSRRARRRCRALVSRPHFCPNSEV